MKKITITNLVVGVVLVLVAACGPGKASPGTPEPGATAPDDAQPAPATPSPSPSTLERAARADSVRQSYSPADVAFMTGMIHHHAQALVMARMAPTHDAGESLRVLSRRIINGQKDEIALMQRWLRERGEAVPEVDEAGRVHLRGDGQVEDGAGHAGHAAHGAAGPALEPMAGMLTPDQMARLDAARGAEWDRLFLTYMIQHHRGALTMVEELFATPGAAQGDAMFKIASDIGADQASEIDRMQRMLHDMIFESKPEESR